MLTVLKYYSIVLFKIWDLLWVVNFTYIITLHLVSLLDDKVVLVDVQECFVTLILYLYFVLWILFLKTFDKFCIYVFNFFLIIHTYET